MKDSQFALLYVVAIGVLWGFIPIFQKELLLVISPIALVYYRFMIAGVLLLLYVICSDLPELVRLLKHPKPVLISTIIGPVPGFLLINYALTMLDASTVIVITSLESAMVYCLSILISYETIEKHKVAGVIFSVVGMVFIFIKETNMTLSFYGDIIALIAVAIISFNTLISKSMLSQFKPIPLVAVNCLLGSLLCLPFLSFADIQILKSLPFNLTAQLFFCIFIGTVFGFPLWYYALSKLSPTKTTFSSYIQPIVGIALGCVLLGEKLIWFKCLGIGLVFLGMALLSMQRNKSDLSFS